MEESYCQCGLYDTQNATTFLTRQRDNHKAACFTDSVLRADFKCAYGSIGFKCTDSTDCQVIGKSVCDSSGMCACQEGYIYNSEANAMACTKDLRGTIGYSCTTNTDCQLIQHSECGIGGVCACQRNFLYTETDSTCKEVSSAVTVKSTTSVLLGLIVLSFGYLL
ncbi:multiple epidermal growth factor-like domains protein 11 [Haliotis rubra]|uniref:multiple epidermal growth factor-like domains protein 11 n=1 Tax=Haliotis rubra TaxID=36100 RepID=UPI001EE571AC|nr:multiple epidermal growth factor-like domains protein 11 [Haliotis rubra]